MSSDPIAPLPHVVLAAILLASLAHCSSDRQANLGASTTPATATTVAMAGRWILSAVNGGSCGMSFGGDPGAREGTIAPEGGCPGRFFTSRKWTYEQRVLVIQDHRGQALAQLSPSAPDRFEGKSSIGPAVTLARPSE
jgi:hypothetical protein